MSTNGKAHEKPPARIKDIYKAYQKLDRASLNKRPELVDLHQHDLENNHRLIQSTPQLLPTKLCEIFFSFLESDKHAEAQSFLLEQPQMFAVPSVPGLFIYPSLLPQAVQVGLLDSMLHRDLGTPEHKTNVHLHHYVPRPAVVSNSSRPSYFDTSSSSLTFDPKDSSIHKAFATRQFLDRKLRWMTLGGQYDWTNKIYPAGPPPGFPQDIRRLVESIFPMKAEAAIVNLYSPGDTLSLHRDVSEECDQPLVSISIGCDGIFVVGLDGSNENGGPRVATIRLQSGDALLMSGESRFAWHGVPRVLEGTCPEWLANWPCLDTKDDGRFQLWRGWMKGKRINLNVRQMFAEQHPE